VFHDASAGLVVPSCELAVARVLSRVPSFRAGMLTLSTVWPEPGSREQPPSLHTEREDGQGHIRLFYIRPCVAFPQGGGGGSAMLPSEGAEHGVSSELLTGNPSGHLCPIC
jgi:anti-sigma factor ChrR (cupin superfamily)